MRPGRARSLPIEKLGNMKPGDEKILWKALERVLANDDGAASKEHLAAGRPVTYRDPHFPDAIMRKWPNGRRELIDVDENGNVTVLGSV